MTKNNDSAVIVLAAILFLLFLAALASTPTPQQPQVEPATEPLIPEVVAISNSSTITKPVPANESEPEPITNETIIGKEGNMTNWCAHLYVPTASSAATYLNNTVLQLAQEMGITHIHLWAHNFDTGVRTITQNQMVDVCTRMQAFGLTPIIDLSYNLTDSVNLVTALGNKCNMYEIGKEPHINNSDGYATVPDYVNYFNTIVSACRAVNPSALYGGPTVGSPKVYGDDSQFQTRSGVYIDAYLQQCDGDFLSVHAYYPTTTKNAVLAALPTNLAYDYDKLTEKMTTYSNMMPIVISEHQYTAGVQTGTDPATNWSWDQSFMDSWTSSCMQTAKAEGFHTIVFWVLIGYDNNFAILRPPAQSYYKKPQYYSIQDFIATEAPTYNASFSANASLQKVQQVTFSANAKLTALQQVAFSANALLQAASPTCVWGEPTVEQWDAFHRSGDVNGDGVINVLDAVLITEHYGESGAPGWIPEDVNSDGIVDYGDATLCSDNQGKSICDLNVQTKTFTANATLQASSYLKEFSADATLATVGVKEFSVGALLTAVVEETAPEFATILSQLEALPKPRKIVGGGTPQVIGGGTPEIRGGVHTDHFEKIIKQAKDAR